MAEVISDTFKERKIVLPTGLLNIQRSGRITGSTAETYLASTIVPAFKDTYPDDEYSTKIQSTYNAAKSVLTYVITAVENANSVALGVTTSSQEAVSIRIDKTGRKTTVTSYDVKTSGNPSDLIDELRPAGTNEESTEAITNPENRLRASFTTIESASGNDLIEWTDSLDEQLTDPDSNQWTYTQSGSAIGRNKFPKAPVSIMNSASAPDRLTYTRVNDVDCRTNWKYVHVYTTRQTIGNTQVSALVRPSSPTFW